MNGKREAAPYENEVEATLSNGLWLSHLWRSHSAGGSTCSHRCAAAPLQRWSGVAAAACATGLIDEQIFGEALLSASLPPEGALNPHRSN